MTTLYVREGAEFREAESNDILTRAHALIAQRYRTGAPVLAEPARTAEFLRIHLGARDYEVFGLLHLDTRHRLIAIEDANHSYAHIGNVKDLGKKFRREVEAFFVNYHELTGATYRILDVKGPTAAHRHVKKGIRANKTR